MEPKNYQDEQDISYEEEQGEEVEQSWQKKIEKLREKLKQCQQEKEQYLAGWQRAQADLINYKKRQEEQISEWQKLTNEKLIVALLPILDSLRKGEETEGLKEIKEQFLDILKNYGLEEIKTIGEKFNPEFHEAIESVESADGENSIIEELQGGYMLNGKIIRAAKVKIIKNN